MKFKIGSCIILFFISWSATLKAQLLCDYVPIEFEDIEPVWRHLVIDTSIIGEVLYFDGEEDVIITDGMTHLSFEGKSFVEGGYLYSIRQEELNLGLSGYLVEKIELTNGELIWQFSTDLRFSDDYEYLIEARVEGNQFVMHGLRSIEEDISPISTVIGSKPYYYYLRRYDLETGKLISHYTPEDTSITALGMKFKINFFYNFIDDGRVLNFEHNIDFGKGNYLIRNVADTLGNTISANDTLVVGAFNDLNQLESIQNRVSRLIRDDDGNYYYYQDFIPNDTSTLTFQSILTKYDKDFNEIKTIDLTEFDFAPFNSLGLSQYKNDMLLMYGCYRTEPGDILIQGNCKVFNVILDKDLNYVKTIQQKFQNEYVGTIFRDGQLFSEDNSVFSTTRRFYTGGNSNFKVYKSNNQNTTDLMHEFVITKEDWVAFVEKIFLLENGNYLLNITHSCYINGGKHSWHPEWIVFSPDDFDIMSKVEDIDSADFRFSIYPNPVMNKLGVKTRKPISGTGQIYNLLGERIESFNFNSSTDIEVNVSGLNSGHYLFHIINNDGKDYIKQFIKAD